QEAGSEESDSEPVSEKAVDVPAEKPAAPKKAPRPEMSAKAQKSFASGQKAFAKGDLKGAKKQYQAAVKADSQAYEANYSLGIVEERLGSSANATKAYKASIATVPDYEPAVVAYSLLLARQGNHD